MIGQFMDVSLRPLPQRLLVITSCIALSMAFQHDSRRTVKDGTGPFRRPSTLLGVCSFGRSTSCCFGWVNLSGVCIPVCHNPCRYGVCVGPDKCSCEVGYEGPQCDQDVNECGLAERPCHHRCMNSPGSYRCYCDPGYALNTDGKACTKEPNCLSLHCQLGCQTEKEGEVICACPPGLHLAINNRTCEDVDECRGALDVCPPRQTCKNTFGGFVCVCKEGFVFGTLQDTVTCRDKNECLDSTHLCSRHAQCVNTAGSYICQCLDNYSGDGHTCWPRRATQSKTSMYYQYKLSKRTWPKQ